VKVQQRAQGAQQKHTKTASCRSVARSFQQARPPAHARFVFRLRMPSRDSQAYKGKKIGEEHRASRPGVRSRRGE